MSMCERLFVCLFVLHGWFDERSWVRGTCVSYMQRMAVASAVCSSTCKQAVSEIEQRKYKQASRKSVFFMFSLIHHVGAGVLMFVHRLLHRVTTPRPAWARGMR
jgi:hypothetical protein